MRKLALSPQAGGAPVNVAELYMNQRKREFSTDSMTTSISELNVVTKADVPPKKEMKSAAGKTESPVVASPSMARPSTKTPVAISPSSVKKKSGPKRNITFDPVILLLNICQFPPETDRTGAVRKCLADVKESQNGTLDVNNVYLPSQWLTPLHIACTHGYSDIARILIEEASAAVNITDKEGWTPLHCAVAEDHRDTIELLCKCQGNLQVPLAQREKDIIYALDGPINLAPRTDDGELPEEIANEDKVDEITKFLKGT